MPVTQRHLDEFGKPFVAVSPAATVADVVADADANANPAETFVVIGAPEEGFYQWLALADVLTFVAEHPATGGGVRVATLPVADMPAIAKSIPQSPGAVRALVTDTHQGTPVAVTDASGAVVAVLYATQASTRAAAAITTSAAQATLANAAPPAVDNVYVTAHYPAGVELNTGAPLLVYAHLQDHVAAMNADVTGASATPPDTARGLVGGVQIPRNTALTITPALDGVDDASAVTFNPPLLTQMWTGALLPFRFAFTVHDEALAGGPLPLRVDLHVGPFLLASLRLAVDVKAAEVRLPTREMRQDTTGLYHRIFISYSRRDRDVAELYRLMQLAAGNTVFMDTYDIRVGEDWKAALARAIEDSTVFQLFWSAHSAGSPYCRAEWLHALDTYPHKGAGQIRPVYWQQPYPPIPDELRHLNFKFVPLAPAG